MRKKLAKLRASPEAFFADSRLPPLRAIAALYRTFRPGGRDPSRSVASAAAADRYVDVRSLRITIVIPVLRSRVSPRRCIESVIAWTGAPDLRVLVVDDGRVDEVTRALVERARSEPRFRVCRHEGRPLDVAEVLARAIEQEPGRDLVLLDPACIVGPRWLEWLALAAYSDSSVASAAAWSDDAETFAAPSRETNRTHEVLSVPAGARIAHRSATADARPVPHTSAPCVYIRRDALDAVPWIASDRLPGALALTEWCLRAGEHGRHHVLALRAYVHHARASDVVGGRQAELGGDGAELGGGAAELDRAYPDHRLRFDRALDGEPVLLQREAMRRAIEEVSTGNAAPPRPRVLFVISTLIGGTPLTNQDLMRAVSHAYEPLLLVCDTTQMQLFDCSGAQPRELAAHTLAERMALVPHTSLEYDRVVASWLVRFGVELVHVRHIAWHGLGLVATATRLAIPVVFSFHDFYTVCPSVNLSNGVDHFSERGVTAPHVIAPLWTKRDRVSVAALARVDPDAFLAQWQRTMSTMLELCDEFVTTSASARDLLAASLPVLRSRPEDVHVVPHGRDFVELGPPPAPPRPGEPLRVLLPGNVGPSKGMRTVLELLRLDRDGAIELHTLGRVGAELAGDARARHHGEYAREDFGAWVTRIRPHLALIPTIVPETFCHALTECWASGLPVVGARIGAIGERLGESGAGWTVDPLDPREIYELLRRIRDGEEDWSTRTDAVLRWQRRAVVEGTLERMAERYVEIYRRATARHRVLGKARDAERRRIALVVRRHFPSSSPTAHVRIATQVRLASGDNDYDWIGAADLVSTDVRAFDGVVVCRNAAPGRVLTSLARQCAQACVPLVLDLDDDLLHVPASKDADGGYSKAAAAVRTLLAEASLTTVSTRRLARSYAPLTREVRVVPNQLDAKLWTTPTPASSAASIGIDSAATIRVLYMGSATHADDLAMVMPAIERLRSRYRLTLHLVGVTLHAPPGAIQLLPPEERYDLFVPWLRTIAPHMHIAVAPLVDTEFNRAKSALKFMEYAMCGLPVVASRVEPYTDTIRDEVDGLLADPGVDAWADRLERLIGDEGLRARLAGAARARAEREFVAATCVLDDLPWDEWKSERARAQDVHGSPSARARAET